MINIGSLCVVSPDTHRSAIIKDIFEKARYKVWVFQSGNEALSTMLNSAIDVVLISSSPTDVSTEDFVSRLHKMPELAHTPIAIDVAADTNLVDWRHEKDGYPVVNDVLPYGLDANATVFRLQPLFRLSTMGSELVLRSPEGKKVAIPNIDNAYEDATRCFYLSLNPSQHLPTSFLAENTFWETASSISEAEALITGPGFFEVAVIDADVPHIDDVIQFCSDMRDNPRLFNLPFLIRVPGVSADDARDLYRAGANRILDSSDADETLRYEAMSLIKLQVSRNFVRDTLRRTLTESTGLPLETVYNEDFLRTYLSKRIDIAHKYGRALSLVHLKLPEADSLREEAGDEACQALSKQLSRWLSRLIRVEDLTAKISDSDFIVILPDTLEAEAQYVMNRIVGVLTFTDFAVVNVFRPVKIWPLIGVSDLKDKDTIDTIMERAQSKLS